MEIKVGDKHEACELLGISPRTLTRYKKQYGWLENIHFFKYNPTTVRYNLTLLQDWLTFRDQPHIHQKACDKYVRSLASSKSK